MHTDSDTELTVLRANGGAIANDFLAQFQADILQLDAERPKVIESTTTAAAYMAGIGCQLWDIEFLQTHREIDKIFSADARG